MSTEEANPVGRPPRFKTADEMEVLVDEYFEALMADEKFVPTVNGLALHLGFTSRQSLINYGGKPEFVDVVKRARTILENAWEQRLVGPNAAGTIFWLKNQGWSDKTEQEISGPGGGPIPTVIQIIGVDPD